MPARRLSLVLGALVLSAPVGAAARPHGYVPPPAAPPSPHGQVHPTIVKHMVPPPRPAVRPPVYVPVYVPVYLPYYGAPWPDFGAFGTAAFRPTLCQSLASQSLGTTTLGSQTLGDLGSGPGSWFAPVVLGSPPAFETIPNTQTPLPVGGMCQQPALIDVSVGI